MEDKLRTFYKWIRNMLYLRKELFKTTKKARCLNGIIDSLIKKQTVLFFFQFFTIFINGKLKNLRQNK
jgi:hypothetical protein